MSGKKHGGKFCLDTQDEKKTARQISTAAPV